ncbi:hypothetical protein ABZW10_33010 [Kitasatospora sp. NPDC004723]|uniref:hypothetical protein n=1 Tax=Kitasatospora sp. NPDC004723 TaxID=3154288 RepID=UPI0033B2CF92
MTPPLTPTTPPHQAGRHAGRLLALVLAAGRDAWQSKRGTGTRSVALAVISALLLLVLLAVLAFGAGWLLVSLLGALLSSVADLAAGLAHTAAGLTVEHLLATVVEPLHSYLAHHAAGPATPGELLAALAAVLAVLHAAARRGNTAARLLLAAVAAATTTAAWQGAPAPGRPLAAFVVGLLFALAAPSAYRRRLRRPLRAEAGPGAPVRTALRDLAGRLSGPRRDGVQQQPRSAASRQVFMHRCRHCARPVDWSADASGEESTRTWRDVDGGAACADAEDGHHLAL